MKGEAFSYHRVAVVTPSVITSIRFANHSLLKEIWTKNKPQVPIGLVHHRLRLLRTVLLQPVCVAQLLGGVKVGLLLHVGEEWSGTQQQQREVSSYSGYCRLPQQLYFREASHSGRKHSSGAAFSGDMVIST